MIPAFEAILFASGEPVETDRFCTIFGVDSEEVDDIMKLLSDRLEKSGSAVKVVRLDMSYQLCTKKEFIGYISEALDLKRRTPLSQAAMEVLAVVAYNQPVTKAYVEQVRGVDCSGVISTLVEKNLLEEKGRLELPGRPLLYGTTDNFLRCFGLTDLTDLPEIPRDDVPADSNGQLKLISGEVSELAQKMADEIEQLEKEENGTDTDNIE